MSSQTDIANIAATILGKPVITSLTQGTNVANALNALYDPVRRGMLEGRSTWRFSIRRTRLQSRADAPASGPYTQWYNLPGDCLKVLLAGDTWPGLDLSDYRLGPTDAGYTVEGNVLLCDYGSPISLLYVSDITETGLFNPCFVMAFGARLAWFAAERITGSSGKKGDAMAAYKDAIQEARVSNALMNPPQAEADDTWTSARMQ